MAARGSLVAAVHGHHLTSPAAPSPARTLLGHAFARADLIDEALTHRSALRHRRGHAVDPAGSNERLEFVGDRVLGLIVAEWLAERFPDEQEGALGRRLASLVSQPVLAAIAQTEGLPALLHVSEGEARAGVRTRATVLADAIEAAIGAIYLDGGIDAARVVVRRAWGDAMARQAEPPKDAKTALQEWAQQRGLDLPHYELASREGPPHAPVFVIAVRVAGETGTGRAGTKRAAEQLAAVALLARFAPDLAASA